jgi:hypothetical protein
VGNWKQPSAEDLAKWKRAHDLRHGRGYSYPRIAEALCIGIGTARTWVAEYQRWAVLRLPYPCSKCDGSGFSEHSIYCEKGRRLEARRRAGLSPADVGEEELLAAIRAAVPRGLPFEVRGDVEQELAVAILAGEVEPGEAVRAARRLARRTYRLYLGRHNPASLDAPEKGSRSRAPLGLRLADDGTILSRRAA